MAFIYIPEDKPEEWDLRRIVREKQEPQNYGKEWIRERIRKQLRREMDERVREYIPDDIQEAIRQLRDAGWLPTQQQRDFENGFGAWVREAFTDVGFLILFLLFVLIGSLYLSQRTMFYILSLILLSVIVVNAPKLRRLIELLKGV